jgi:hypothetical protein
MKLHELLLLKLRQELQEDLMKRYKSNSDLQSYSEEEFKLSLIRMINDKTKDLKITIDDPPEKISNVRNRCCARIYTKHRHMEGRCSSRCFGNTEYCRTHLNRLEREGYLSFGRYDEKRPSINEKGNPIPWQDLTAMESIDLVVQYQDMNLKKLTNTINTTPQAQ